MASRKTVTPPNIDEGRSGDWETLLIVAAAGAAIVATLFWFWLCLSSQFM